MAGSVDLVASHSDLPIFVPVPGHHAPVPFYLMKDMFGGLPVEIAGGEVSDKVDRPVAAPHRHEVPEIYLLVSPNPGGARIVVEVEGERHFLSSPAVLYVPAQAEHHFVTLRAERGSYCFGILLGSREG